MGIEPERAADWEVELQWIQEAAEAIGAGFVSLSDVFSGPGHDGDSRAKGWIDGGGMHAGDEGLTVAADALAAVGFEMNEPPR